MAVKPLFDDEDVVASPEDPTGQLTVNKDFEKRFNSRKDKEELQRLSKKFEDASDAVSETTSEDEDSDAELLSREVDAKILETLARIKTKDPSIYKPDHVFFKDDDFPDPAPTATEKPLTFTKFLSSALKKDGADAMTKEEERLETLKGPPVLSYEAEQRALKDAFLAAAENVDDRDDLLETAVKTEEERRQEDASFRAFLESRVQTKEGDESKLLARYLQGDDILDEKDRFLRDYVLLEGWKDSHKMPQGKRLDTELNDEEREDEEILEAADQFEAAYNFRFEEDAVIEIEGHARKVFDSVRLKENKRRQRRLERLERKKKEKEEQAREIEQFKKLKRKEILERLQLIQRVAGIKTPLDASVVNLEKEFDPEEHDAEVAALLGDDFMEQEETNVEELLTSPPELAEVAGHRGDAAVSVDAGPMSSRQKKKLEKLAKKRSALMEDDGSAYAPFLDTTHDDPHDENALGDAGGNGFSVDSGAEEEPPTPPQSHDDDATDPQAPSYVNEQGETAWFLCDGCQYGIREGAKRYRKNHDIEIACACSYDCSVCENVTFCTRCFRSIRHPHHLPPPETLYSSEAVSATASHASEIDTQAVEDLGPEQRALMEAALEEYYSLDYEDLIGGMPVRFKYRKVEPDDGGMSLDDILNRDDKELNQIVPLKQLAPYRVGRVKRRFRQAARDYALGRKRRQTPTVNGSDGKNAKVQRSTNATSCSRSAKDSHHADDASTFRASKRQRCSSDTATHAATTSRHEMLRTNSRQEKPKTTTVTRSLSSLPEGISKQRLAAYGLTVQNDGVPVASKPHCKKKAL